MWAVIVLIILVPFAIAGTSFAPWVPTNTSDLQRLKKIIKLKKGDRFLEFGCGDARVSHYIAKHNPDIEVLWVEMAFPIYLMAKIRQLFSPQENLTLKLGSGFKQDFSDFDVIYMFGMPDSIAKKILPKFEKEAKKGTRLVSYVFSFKDTKYQTESFEKKWEKSIHILTK